MENTCARIKIDNNAELRNKVFCLPERLLCGGIVSVPLQRLLSCDSILHKNKVASLNGFDNSSLYP